MINISPSLITFTPTKDSTVITITGERAGSIRQQDIQLVAVQSDREELSERVCSGVSFSSMGILRTVSAEKTSITLTIDKALSLKLQECRIEKNETLALRIVIPQTDRREKVVSIQSKVLIPISDNSQGTLLHKARSNEVLGELARNLTVSNITCNKVLLFARSDLTCQATVSNTTDTGILTNLVSTLREGLPPGSTLYENIERTSTLILPGESLSLSFVVPKNSLAILNNYIGISSSFTTLANDTPSFVVRKEATVWYVPSLLLACTFGILLLISAILLKQKIVKFTTLKHGDQKAND